MDYQLTNTPHILSQGCHILGFHDPNTLQTFFEAFDFPTQNTIKHLAQTLTEKGQWCMHQASIDQNFMLYQLGDEAQWKTETLLQAIQDIMPLVFQQKQAKILISFPPVPGITADTQMQHTLLMIDVLCFQSDTFKSTTKPKHALQSVSIMTSVEDSASRVKALAIAEGVRYARTLGDMPANHCTPGHLAEAAQKLAFEYPAIKTTVHDKNAIQKLGMGAFLAVAQGSDEPPVFIEMHYQPKNTHNTAPIVLIGKGITFDAGGISLKPAAGMEEMKYDMGGAASVLGVMQAIAQLNLPLYVMGLIPATENLPSGKAIKPGDVVTSLSGQTIEIVNTDAEGRLILADALTYARRFNPEFVLDMATLTGAMVIALGDVYTGFFTEDTWLAEHIERAAMSAHDKAWRMPLDSAYQKALDSPVADMLNATFDRVAGSVTAACFLARFTEGLRWAHFDIAGTAWVSGKNRKATGRPVPLLIELLCHAAKTR